MKSFLVIFVSIVTTILGCTTVHIPLEDTLVVGRTMELGNGHDLLSRCGSPIWNKGPVLLELYAYLE